MVAQYKIKQLQQALDSRILVIDGAMGTALQALDLSAADFGGEQWEGCNENLIRTRPEIIQKIHEDYLEAGCDIVETNTFGATPLVLDEYGLGKHCAEINQAAAQIARQVADRYSSPSQPRFVAGSIGPTTKAISVTGGISFAQLEQNFYEQARALQAGGVDYFLLETCQDTRNVKAAIFGIQRLQAETQIALPIAVSGTIEPTGTMLAGQSIEALLSALSHLDLLYLGLNCATGPEFMTDPIRSLAKISQFRLACVPNAGLPDENGCYLESPEMLATVLGRFLSQGWLNVLGGCCGTHAGHIRALVELARSHKARAPCTATRSMLSGIDYLEITDDLRPVIVGERSNVIGSRVFKNMICAEKFEEASEVARSQIKNGAHLVDICLANPDRDELQDMRSFLEFATKKIRAPMMIDSTDAQVIELALGYNQGKAIINSINLEDGEERFNLVIPLAKKYGAALVVGTIDDDPEQGMGVKRQRKLEIAERSYEILTQKWQILPEDIYWDPLVFPCGTGDPQYLGSAQETIEGIRLIKARFPRTRTILGISNVSFGLPPAGREVLNSVFLYECVQAGLDLAIVNSEKLMRYASIPDDEKALARRLLLNSDPTPSANAPVKQPAGPLLTQAKDFPKNQLATDPLATDPLMAFTQHFRNRVKTAPTERPSLPVKERLARCIVEGSKEGLQADLHEVLQTMRPLEIINGPLMKGMDEVGRLFNSNQLIVAEVLQSAEAMKAAVAFLEPFMEKTESSLRGKVLLATVKGDVHDIGKNLVDIILSNNGFQVINLGIKVPPEQLIAAVRQHKPDLIGLSGLLVKSAQQMVITVEDFSRAGIKTPILVGGAALTSNFVDRQIAKTYITGVVAYAKDAMNGLELAKTIVDPESFEKLKSDLQARRTQKLSEAIPKISSESINGTTEAPTSKKVQPLQKLPQPSDLERHVILNTPIETIWKYVNPLMLYGRHLGIRGGTVRELENSGTQKVGQNSSSARIWDAVQAVKEEYRKSDLFKSRAVYQFFPASSQGDCLLIHDADRTQKVLSSFEFLRQKKSPYLCLSDYTVPRAQNLSDHAMLEAQAPPSIQDTVALFVVSVGNQIREISTELKDRGQYLKSHIVQALALESAEAYAELLHAQIRKIWGFPDPPEMTMMQRFQAKYRGCRYSFGYPACPRLEDQRLLWKLIRPEEIGVELTDGDMMDPEASVSAIVFHHPEAFYFSVGQQAVDEKMEANRA